jgi:hypothetical protein
VFYPQEGKEKIRNVKKKMQTRRYRRKSKKLP